jgi:peroxiredoxin
MLAPGGIIPFLQKENCYLSRFWRQIKLRTGLLLSFLLILSQVLAAQESVEQILARTQEVYKSANIYQFSGAVLYDWKDNDNKSRTFRQIFQCYRGEGGKLRYQLGLGMSKILALSDGAMSLLYLADKRKYQKSNSSDLEAFIRSSLDIENASWVFPSIALLEKYSHLSQTLRNATLLKSQDLILNGRTFPCMVLEGIMDPTDIDVVRGNRKTQLWIERDRYVVRQEVSAGTSTDNPAKGEKLRETITFDIAKMNEALAEDLFTLDSPTGTEEVRYLFAPDKGSEDAEQASSDNRPLSFNYELPFAAMRNFKLPCVDGGQLSLAQFRGKFVILDFWATWCAPCHKLRDDLEKILRKYKNTDLVVLGINDESLEKTRAFIKKRAPTYPLLVDTGGSLSSLYGANILPTLVLLDPSGRMIFKREERLMYEQIEHLLREAGL